MAAEINLLDIILHAGWIVKIVLLLLAGASVLSWGVIWHKSRMLSELRELNARFLTLYNSSEGLKEIKDKTSSLEDCPYKLMFIYAYDEIAKLKKRGETNSKADFMATHFENYGLGIIERGLKKGVNEAQLMMEEHLALLASIGSITPFIGLFGTVWGIIDSFTGLASGGTSLETVAPGIAEALVATAIGLFAAIPAVWFYNKFSNANGRMTTQMESFGQDFMNNVERTLAKN